MQVHRTQDSERCIGDLCSGSRPAGSPHAEAEIDGACPSWRGQNQPAWHWSLYTSPLMANVHFQIAPAAYQQTWRLTP